MYYLRAARGWPRSTPGWTPYRAFWSERLDALEQHLEENPE